MLHCQILPPPPTVEDTMDNVVLTPYNRPESAFNFEGWQETPLRGLLSLLPRSPPLVAATPCTDSSLEAVIHSVLLQFHHNTAKVKPLYEVRDPPPATQNSRACEHNSTTTARKGSGPRTGSEAPKPAGSQHEAATMNCCQCVEYCQHLCRTSSTIILQR